MPRASAAWLSVTVFSAGVTATFYRIALGRAITWDGTTTRIYRNGQQVESGAFPGPLGTNGNAIIGADSNGTVARGSYYDGTMDEVALYDRALTAGEVLAHYDEGNGAP